MSEVNPDAIDIAKKLDEERQSTGSRGPRELSSGTPCQPSADVPVHGIPFVVKDNYYTDDKHNTSEGGLVLLGGRYSVEAPAVTKAREAGMRLLGHAALSVSPTFVRCYPC